MKQSDFDVLVVGGGHAGTEAAHAVHRLGGRVALVTMREADLGALSCNPAVGGLGKGHLVREIDALGGIMGQLADRAGIQFRLLNRSRGPAVQGPRAQQDRAAYRAATRDLFSPDRGPRVIYGEVRDLIVQNGEACGVRLADGSDIASRTVVLATGTFLGGRILIGDRQSEGGRAGDRASIGLSRRLRDLGLDIGRLKTGTPPRILRSSIRWDELELQAGDDDPVMFSFLSDQPVLPQVACGITHTNEMTHAVIRDNLSRSAMYGGHVEGVGPRYCPSIEDKITRFADKPSHQVFLEPEGLESDLVYPNGISTSLPADVQEQYVRTIKGLETAEIRQPGYAIEYDYVDPRSLDASLELRAIPNLFLAGQINGTTGYEEAGAQGLVAGLNAYRRAVNEACVPFPRTESYIGVMLDDLTTRGVTEPYRMFTSRAEFRLTLRADNADERLTPLGLELGCVDDTRKAAFLRKMDAVTSLTDALLDLRLMKGDLGGGESQKGRSRRTAYALLSDPDVSSAEIRSHLDGAGSWDHNIWVQVERNALYANYVERQERDKAALMRDENIELPTDFDYERVGSLTTEQREKLSRIRPRTLGQAGRIEGMTPAGLLAILSDLRNIRQKAG